jgi:hypothetical protein
MNAETAAMLKLIESHINGDEVLKKATEIVESSTRIKGEFKIALIVAALNAPSGEEVPAAALVTDNESVNRVLSYHVAELYELSGLGSADLSFVILCTDKKMVQLAS